MPTDTPIICKQLKIYAFKNGINETHKKEKTKKPRAFRR